MYKLVRMSGLPLLEGPIHGGLMGSLSCLAVVWARAFVVAHHGALLFMLLWLWQRELELVEGCPDDNKPVTSFCSGLGVMRIKVRRRFKGALPRVLAPE